MNERYMYVAFPKQTHIDGRPLILCYKEEAPGLGRVKIYSDVPTPANVYLLFMHEELFVNPP